MDRYIGSYTPVSSPFFQKTENSRADEGIGDCETVRNCHTLPFSSLIAQFLELF